MIDEPLVQQHLRVCWENHRPIGNCGACEKCLRTMLILEGHGRLETFPVFPDAAALVRNLTNLHRLRHDLVPVYSQFLKTGLSSKVHNAVQSLIERSQLKTSNSLNSINTQTESKQPVPS
jgi:hypothetical protein